MRAILLTAVSVALLSGCSITQENPNYEFSSRYKGDPNATHQYADAQPSEVTSVTYESASHQSASHQNASTQPAVVETVSTPSLSISMDAAPTDMTYSGQDVSGTPGFMAMQTAEVAPITPMISAPLVAPDMNTSAIQTGGTPVNYDMSQNMIAIDAVTTGLQPEETVRMLPQVENYAGQSYVVQPGDTVYSLSRRTCIGVNVIQSMNGLSADYGIKIGQTLTLPNSVC